MTKYEGSCHCGGVKYEVQGELESLLECNCSICSRKGYLFWFVPRAALSVKTPLENLSTYTFNKHVIKHLFCPECGCAPFGLGSDDKGNEMAAINARCLQGIDLAQIKINPFDGRAL